MNGAVTQRPALPRILTRAVSIRGVRPGDADTRLHAPRVRPLSGPAPSLPLSVPTMKRGADRQLTKDDSDEDHVRVFRMFMGLTLTFVLFTKGEDGPGSGFKKAEETVLATRKYVIRRIIPGG